MRICADCYACLSWDNGCARGVITVPDRCALCNPVPEPEGEEAETRPMFEEDEP